MQAGILEVTGMEVTAVGEIGASSMQRVVPSWKVCQYWLAQAKIF
jgi:hypothetical protein